MNQSSETSFDLEEFFKLSSNNYLWYFWSQHPDLTIKEVTGININFKIKAKEVELIDEWGQSHGIYPLQELVSVAKRNSKDVIQLKENSNGYMRVMVARFSSFQDLYVSEIGLYSKKRPWIIKTDKKETVGLRIVDEGFPRSRDKVDEGDLRNENELLHKNHLDDHKCALKDDGRVLKKYRKSIKVEAKNYICTEVDSNFISELLNE